MNAERDKAVSRQLEKLLRECEDSVPDTQEILHDLIILLYTKHRMEEFDD